MTSGVRIAVIKPDFGVAGGFEALLSGLVACLADAGHRIDHLSIPGHQMPRPIWGQPDAASRWYDHPDYFNYLGMVHDLRRLELDEFDLVLSTQPPSYLAPHDRILGLFYHQARTFYELSESYIADGFGDADRHRQASENVRRVDQAHLGGVTHWLAGSQVCAERLRTSWTTNAPISVLDAPPLTEFPDEVPAWSPGGPVLCVSRHEWPKRTELAVAAGHLMEGPTQLIGGGGRLEHVRRLNDEIAAGNVDGRTLSTEWLGAIAEQHTSLSSLSDLGRQARQRAATAIASRRARHNVNSPAHSVSIDGRLDDAARNGAYASASVVLAPALNEDYGLTALEAMVWGRPVVVCRDGGGLVEIVEATGGGLVVEPSPVAIAEAVERIRNDAQLAMDLRAGALSVRETHTWERANQQLLDAIDSSLARPQ